MEVYKLIFVFGANLAGIHGAGAALTAYHKYGAQMGRGVGLSGNSYAIPTKNQLMHSLTLPQVKVYVDQFISFAKKNSEMHFKVTQIGCGLAGFSPEEIAPLFKDAPSNCAFDEKWKPYLGNMKAYWGTF